ncbi:MAG: ABC transporter substrate-binding protein [Methylobacterium frigidaeris]
MGQTRRMVLGALAAPFLAAAPAVRRARAAEGPVRIGALSDLSSAYADISGPALVKAVQMAIDDFGPCLGRKAELLAADCGLKPDVSSVIARNWFDTQGVDAIIDMPSTAITLAVMQLAADKRRIVLATSAGSSDISGKHCSPYTSHWVYDSHAMARTIGPTIVREGGDTWYFIAADYAFGAALVKDASDLVQASGGRVLGVSRAPLNTADFSSYLLQAQASGAKIITLANGGADAVNAIKQAHEFGIQRGGQRIAALVLMDTDVRSIGLPTAQGTLLATAFYWDRTEATRAWSRRFHEMVGRMPTMLQAGAYSQATHYLKAVQAAGTRTPEAVMDKMRELPVDDAFVSGGRVRRDGLMIHPMYLARVKAPAESRGTWDQLDIVATVPGDEAFRALDKGGCRLV